LLALVALAMLVAMLAVAWVVVNCKQTIVKVVKCVDHVRSLEKHNVQ
jgi:hypothetical protein